MFVIRWLLLPILAAIAFAFAGGFVNGIPSWPTQGQQNLALALLIPDDADLNDPKLTAWQDAAQEEGIKLKVISASQFLRPFPFNSVTYAGLILPDSIHTAMSETLIGGIHNYVGNGGKLLLAFDAGTLLFPNRTYAKDKSQFSDLAGIDYALYDHYRDQTIQRAGILGKSTAFLSLHTPPGKFIAAANGKQLMSLSSYQHESLELPHFITRGAYTGTPLLYGSDDSLIAGLNAFRNGTVLFVNLPLGYLKNRTDGGFLHGFIRYFAEDIVKLPILSSAPDGRGGLIVNFHIDSSANLPVLKKLKKESKLFNYGPYSVHITAGPDVNVEGDKLGFNVPSNTEAMEWIKFFQARGDQIGSHGGWIHNYFGEHLNDTNRSEFLPFLEKNKQALENVTGTPINEYSAPMGNHPHWVTEWLANQNVGSYYFTGDIGMGATKSYHNERQSKENIWAFPVLTMGKHAAFEEMHADNVDEQSVSQWLNDVSNYTADDRVVRLIYFHPPGIRHYPRATDDWLSKAESLAKAERFNWYTMTDIAQFMNQRGNTEWNIRRLDRQIVTLSAQHPVSLAHITWLLPRDDYENPEIVKGKAIVSTDNKHLVITAQDEKSLEINFHARSKYQ